MRWPSRSSATRTSLTPVPASGELPEVRVTIEKICCPLIDSGGTSRQGTRYSTIVRRRTCPLTVPAGPGGFLTGTTAATGGIVTDRVGDCPQRNKRRGGFPVVRWQYFSCRCDASRGGPEQHRAPGKDRESAQPGRRRTGAPRHRRPPTGTRRSFRTQLALRDAGVFLRGMRLRVVRR